MMAIQVKSMEYAKEIDDVMALFVEVIKNRKNKESISNLIDELAAAVGGIEDIDDELAGHRKIALQTIGARVGELVDAFLPSNA